MRSDQAERNRVLREGRRYPQAATAVMTHAEVAQVLTQQGCPMTTNSVKQAEARALLKLFNALKHTATPPG